MGKLVIVFAALFIAAVAAESNNLLANLKSLENVKRAANLLKPLKEQKKDADSIKLLMTILDTDHDGMLNVDEVKAFIATNDVTPNEEAMFLDFLMGFDKDLNNKLDINEMVAIDAVLGF